MVKKAVTSILALFVIVSIGFLAFKAGNGKSAAATGASGNAPGGNGTPVQQTRGGTGDGGVSHEIIDLTPVEGPSRQVVAVYFYNDTRCRSCLTIEKWTNEALTEGFDNELKAKTLSWRMVNTDVKENEHYLKDYDIYTKSVVLVEYVDGKQAGFVNLEKVWDKLKDEADFKNYVTTETRAFLDGKTADAATETASESSGDAASDAGGTGKGA